MAKRRPSLKKPLSVGEILAAGVLGPKGAHLLNLFHVRQSWVEIVGAQLAQKTSPKFIKGGTLFVTTESPVWAQHLSLMQDEIFAAIRERTGAKFGEIRFVSGRQK